ncbi:LacI family transcriptional regulator [Paenibacillus sp. HWE-109]|uniref:LacI family DNA-binding transcriptional regulator n=1 Tax=Paenibacillus sp. HWE-109 TaxID=1306526 RepID=UPI001EDDB2EF|nr:LacI family DNA-binding transcriptional regulator [Paenibacillus sp. HWE-109]UKS30876.1 LacI family transcriptional regulator [Paenibacillus sp. HWE-109]
MQKRVTSFDVARKAGVSRGVVSAVLNQTAGIRVSEETRAAVLQAIEELGYRVDVQARGMRLGRSQCFAAFGNMDNPLFLQMLQGFQKRCTQAGYHVLLYGTDQDEAARYELLEMFRERRIDGIVSKDATQYADEAWAQAIQENKVPYISVDGYAENEAVCSVLMDYKASMKIALDHIWQKTSSSPIYMEVYSGPAYSLNWGDRQRRLGYEEWMIEHGLNPTTINRMRNDREPNRSEWVSILREMELPAAVVCNWSYGARRIYEACHELHLRIGKDVYVMAADNTEQVNAYMIPPLSAVEVPYQHMGELAAQRLLQYVTADVSLADTSTIRVPCRLEIREY